MNTFGCVNNTIRLRSGLYLDLASPQPDQFTFADIAGGLSKICRFGGQCRAFYSVAEHSFHCAQQAQLDGLSVESRRTILMHDAAEAFIGDVVKPLKIMLPDYAQIETLMEDCIANKYDLDGPAHEVRKIDREMLIAERRAMFTGDNVMWHGESEVRAIYPLFGMWPPEQAETAFKALAHMVGIRDDE